MTGNLARNSSAANNDAELDVLRIGGRCWIGRGNQCGLAVDHDALSVQDRALARVHRKRARIKIDIGKSLARPVALPELLLIPGDYITFSGRIGATAGYVETKRSL